MGIRRSSPVCSTLLNMSSISWQQLVEENNIVQSIAHKYLPSSAFLLSRLSHSNRNLDCWRQLSLTLASTVQWYYGQTGQRMEALRSNVKAVQVSQDMVQDCVLSGWNFHCLLEAEMPFDWLPVKTIEVSCHNKSAIREAWLDKLQWLEQVFLHKLVLSGRPMLMINAATIREENPRGRCLGRSWTYNASWSRQHERASSCLYRILRRTE